MVLLKHEPPRHKGGIHLSNYLEGLQKSGRMTPCTPKAMPALNVSKAAFNRSVERLIKKHRLAHPARGFYVIVPIEHQDAGAPPATSFIHSLMEFHAQPYYCGCLSAAALHGAAHQAPQELQVVTSAPLKTINVGRSRIRFITKRRPETTPTQLVRVPPGTFLFLLLKPLLLILFYTLMREGIFRMSPLSSLSYRKK